MNTMTNKKFNINQYAWVCIVMQSTHCGYCVRLFHGSIARGFYSYLPS